MEIEEELRTPESKKHELPCDNTPRTPTRAWRRHYVRLAQDPKGEKIASKHRTPFALNYNAQNVKVCGWTAQGVTPKDVFNIVLVRLGLNTDCGIFLWSEKIRPTYHLPPTTSSA